MKNILFFSLLFFLFTSCFKKEGHRHPAALSEIRKSSQRTIVVDNFETGKHYEKKIKLKFKPLGKRVSFKGATRSKNSTREIKLLTIMVDLEDAKISEEFPRDKVVEKLKGLKDWYETNTNGLYRVNLDVNQDGEYDIAYKRLELKFGNCGESLKKSDFLSVLLELEKEGLKDGADEEATIGKVVDNYDLESYTHVQYVTADSRGGVRTSCNYAGVAFIGDREKFDAERIHISIPTASIGTYVHEMGHTLGLHHSNLFSDRIQMGNEYEDHTCPMGRGRHLFNPPKAEYLGIATAKENVNLTEGEEETIELRAYDNSQFYYKTLTLPNGEKYHLSLYSENFTAVSIYSAQEENRSLIYNFLTRSGQVLRVGTSSARYDLEVKLVTIDSNQSTIVTKLVSKDYAVCAKYIEVYPRVVSFSGSSLEVKLEYQSNVPRDNFCYDTLHGGAKFDVVISSGSDLIRMVRDKISVVFKKAGKSLENNFDVTDLVFSPRKKKERLDEDRKQLILNLVNRDKGIIIPTSFISFENCDKLATCKLVKDEGAW